MFMFWFGLPHQSNQARNTHPPPRAFGWPTLSPSGKKRPQIGFGRVASEVIIHLRRRSWPDLRARNATLEHEVGDEPWAVRMQLWSVPPRVRSRGAPRVRYHVSVCGTCIVSAGCDGDPVCLKTGGAAICFHHNKQHTTTTTTTKPIRPRPMLSASERRCACRARALLLSRPHPRDERT